MASIIRHAARMRPKVAAIRPMCVGYSASAKCAQQQGAVRCQSSTPVDAPKKDQDGTENVPASGSTAATSDLATPTKVDASGTKDGTQGNAHNNSDEHSEESWWDTHRSDIKYIGIALAITLFSGIPTYLISGLQDDVELREKLRIKFPTIVSALGDVLEIPDDIQPAAKFVKSVPSDEQLEVTLSGTECRWSGAASTTLRDVAADLHTKSGVTLTLYDLALRLRFPVDSNAAPTAKFSWKAEKCVVPSAVRAFLPASDMLTSAGKLSDITKMTEEHALELTQNPLVRPLWNSLIGATEQHRAAIVAKAKTASQYTQNVLYYSPTQEHAHRLRASRIITILELRALNERVIPQLEEEERLRHATPTLPTGMSRPRLPALTSATP